MTSHKFINPFHAMVSFYTPWKHQIEKDQWHEMCWSSLSDGSTTTEVLSHLQSMGNNNLFSHSVQLLNHDQNWRLRRTVKRNYWKRLILLFCYYCCNRRGFFSELQEQKIPYALCNIHSIFFQRMISYIYQNIYDAFNIKIKTTFRDFECESFLKLWVVLYLSSIGTKHHPSHWTVSSFICK